MSSSHSSYSSVGAPDSAAEVDSLSKCTDSVSGEEKEPSSPGSSEYAGERDSSVGIDTVDGVSNSGASSCAPGKRHGDEVEASVSWRKKRKPFFVISGEPIYSRASGGEDPPRIPGSVGSKTRGLTTGATSTRAMQGVQGANVVIYDLVRQTFYQDVREKNKKIGVFSNRIGNLIKSMIPVYIKDWNEVLPQHVATLLSALHTEYTFVYEDPVTGERVSAGCYRSEINAAIIRDAKRIRRGQKTKLSARFFGHFCGDKELAREETPKGYKQEDWLKAIEAFDTEEYKIKSERNRQNSKKKMTKSRQGSIPLLAHRRKNRREDGTLASPLATWKKKHQDDEGNWTTDSAENKFEQITALVTDIMRKAENKGEEVSIDDAEAQAMGAVFGHRRDWDVGIGPTIPRSSLLLARAQDPSSSNSSSRKQFDPAVSELKDTLLKQQAMMEEMQRQISALTQMQRQNQKSPLRTQSSPTTPQPRTTPPSATMVNDQTLVSVEFHRELPSGNATRGGNDRRRGSGGSRGGRLGRITSTIDKWYRPQHKE